jgi:opacity protein-like surface antigen
MKRLLLLLVILFTLQILNAQENIISEKIAFIAQELAEHTADQVELEKLSERLFELYEKPVRINSGDEQELSRLFFLTDFQILSIADYVKTTGAILSVNELPLIPGFNQSAAGMIIPFITLARADDLSPGKSRFRQRIISSIAVKPGEKDVSWLGSPWKGITRYRADAGRIRGGYTAEKDPGERLFNGSPPLPDFFSAYVSYESAGIIKNLVAGDYSLRFGHGLAINTTLRSTLYLTTPGNLSGSEAVRPYTSADENNFFRGVAGTLGTAKARLTLFLSSNKTDATIRTGEDPVSVSVSSLYRAGYHNTVSTLNKKDAVTENAAGANFSFDARNFRGGVLFSANLYSIPFSADTSEPEGIYRFTGRWNPLLSSYYKLMAGRFILSGEAAANDPAGIAFVQGLQARPSDRITINMVYRYSSPGYFSAHGKIAGISSGSFSGSGLFAGFSLEAARNLFVSAGADLIQNRWISYRSSSPSSSLGEEIKIQFLPPSGLIIESLLTYRRRSYDKPVETGIPTQEENGYTSFRVKFTYPVNEKLRFVSRLDIKQSFPDESKGYLLLQDISYTTGRRPLSIWLRYSMFNTDSYDSGIYTWENDILNSYSVPVLYGNGNRFCLMASWKPVRSTELRFRYSQTVKNEGNSTVKFPELKFQIRIMI